ncbi:MAG TPA: hypothetical protein VFS90_15855 [Pyrinomonadaceae bacterium]|nr:hypothetical protein [Pyrinomonadaceae bacterium]
MPLSHENVTATVSITGVALGVYNPTTQNFEVGLIRHDTHTLTVEVRKKLAERDSVMKFILDKNHRLFIDAENAILPENPIYQDGENFSRDDPDHDKEDFRWVVDFETELNNGEPVALQRPQDLVVTEMYVSKPTLYADRKMMTTDKFNLVTIDANGAPVPNSARDFGKFTEGMKADIRCQAGGAVILRIDGPQGFQIHLPHGSAEPHEINIENLCAPKENAAPSREFKPTDFSLFYSVIVDTDGKKFDFQRSNPDEEGQGAVCNGTVLGKSTKLFPF